MFGSNILDAAIGLLFVYVVLSLICSAAHEILEGFLKYRSSDLERGLRELLESNSQNTMVTETVYNHPLIGGLFKGKYVPGKTHNLPSYIPAHNFALAVMDLVKSSVNLAANTLMDIPEGATTVNTASSAVTGSPSC